MTMKYADFEVHIFTHDQKLMIDINGRPYAINLAHPLELPIVNTPFDFRTALSLLPKDVQQLGHGLFNAVFINEIASRFQAYVNRRKEQEGVRVCVSSQSGQLSDTAWEILCSSLEPIVNYLSLDPKTPVVRSPRISKEVYLREMTLPLRLLVVFSSPRHVQSIDAKTEKMMLEKTLGVLQKEGHIEVDFLGFDMRGDASFDRLQEFLSVGNSPYDIVHMIGHGLLEESDEGVFALTEPRDGRQDIVRASSLANLFRSRGVMLVILQSCQSGATNTSESYYSGLAQQLVAAGVPSVLAMQETIDQDVARHFVEKLYTSWLVQELLFEDAITQARQSVYKMFEDQPVAWAIPALYICPGVQLITHRVALSRKPIVTDVRLHSSFEVGERQIDAALPHDTRLNKQTELAVLIRTPTSPGLREMIAVEHHNFEATPDDVRISSLFNIVFMVDDISREILPANVRVIVEANGFDVISTDETVQIRYRGDSVLLWVLLTPRQEGIGRVLVKVIDNIEGQQVTLGQVLLKTLVHGGDDVFQTEYHVVGTSSSPNLDNEEPLPPKSLDELQKLRNLLPGYIPQEQRLVESLSILRDMTNALNLPSFSSRRFAYEIIDVKRAIESIYDGIDAISSQWEDIVVEKKEEGASSTQHIPIFSSVYKLLRLCKRISERCEDLLLIIDRENNNPNYLKNEISILGYEVEDLQKLLSFLDKLE